jgi:YD repeat-containing protein
VSLLFLRHPDAQSSVWATPPDGTPNDLSNNPKIAEYDYTVRADGRRTDLLERFFTSGGVVENSYSWSYDALNRLTSETIDSSNDALDRTTSWTFDLTGNRLNQIVDVGNNGSLDAVTSYTYDANDRLVREQTDKTGTADDTTTFYGYTGTQQSAKNVYSGLQARVFSSV